MPSVLVLTRRTERRLLNWRSRRRLGTQMDLDTLEQLECEWLQARIQALTCLPALLERSVDEPMSSLSGMGPRSCSAMRWNRCVEAGTRNVFLVVFEVGGIAFCWSSLGYSNSCPCVWNDMTIELLLARLLAVLRIVQWKSGHSAP